MNVTYIAHSGFLAEWDDCYMLFDYFKGELPPLNPEKKLVVFVSHSHSDHFSPAIFTLFSAQRSVEYIISTEARTAVKRALREADIAMDSVAITFLPMWEDCTVTDGAGNPISVHALRSTDAGAAFCMEYLGKTIYHAGDLHWWSWPGEPEDENQQMIADYKKEAEYLRGRHIYLAFNPLDPRQEEDMCLGMDYLLSIAQIDNLFPMHMWDDYSAPAQFTATAKLLTDATAFYMPQHTGQTWRL